MSLLATRGLLGTRSVGAGRRSVVAPTRSLKAQNSLLPAARQTGRSLPALFALQRSAALARLNGSFYTSSSVRVFSTEASEVPQTTVEALPEKARIPRLPLLLTAISVVPYLACAAIPFAFPLEIAGKALFMQMTYGAVSLTMLGSVHWGLAMADYKRVDDVSGNAVSAVPSTSDHMLRYVGGVLPAIASWMFMTQEPVIGMLGLMSGITAMALFEVGAHQARLLPSWYVRIRIPWTITAIFSLGINLIHLL